ncbi:MAG TPA: hypothetical protein VFZ61_15455 [Polyangiales bacterium]
MQVSIEADRGHVNQLGELIALDRSSAGESRRALAPVPLRTAEYTVPLRLLLKQRWREERRTCVAALGVVAALSLLLGLHLAAPSFPLSSAGSERSLGPALRVDGDPQRGASQPAALPVLPAPAVIAPPDGRPSNSGAPSLSVQLRLQRADLWLRIGTPRAAQEARRLQESALAERPGSAHGHAALAQACLILEDQGCARDAIEQAQRARPWRAGYRSLSRQIARAFETR